MIWKPKWPFQSPEQALAYERAYRSGYYSPEGSCSILIVEPRDLELEKWLESEGTSRLRDNPHDTEVIQNIWLWKMRSTVEAGGKCADPPANIVSKDYAESLGAALRAENDFEMVHAINKLVAFAGIQVRAASAFIYWLRPEEYQVIDRRATSALNLDFSNSDYTPDNYLRYCALSRCLQQEHGLTLRQIDRALFTYEKLLSRKKPMIITI